MRDIHFEGNNNTIPMMQFAIYCHRIRVLRATDIALTSAVRDLIWVNQNLQELRLNKVTCADTMVLKGVALHNLNVLEIRNSACQEGFVGYLTVECFSLKTMVMDGSSFFDMDKVTANCLLLRSYSGGIVEKYMEQFSLCALRLMHLSITNRSWLSDQSVGHIVKNIICLRSLDIRDCTLLTDICLQYIAD